MSHNDLGNFYLVEHQLSAKYSPEALGNMFPFERDLKIDMILNDMRKKQQQT